jgi:hypothetical protein
MPSLRRLAAGPADIAPPILALRSVPVARSNLVATARKGLSLNETHFILLVLGTDNSRTHDEMGDPTLLYSALRGDPASGEWTLVTPMLDCGLNPLRALMASKDEINNDHRDRSVATYFAPHRNETGLRRSPLVLSQAHMPASWPSASHHLDEMTVGTARSQRWGKNVECR